MKIYISHSSNFDYRAKLYEPIKAGIGTNHDIFYPHDTHEDGVNTKSVITGSDLVLAEVSYPSTGQGIELGWADTAGVPIICFYQSNTTVSSALQFLNAVMVSYDNANDMTMKLQVAIKK